VFNSMSLPVDKPVRLAIIGLGGYAAAHHEAAIKLEAEGVVRLVATCDPAIDSFAKRCTELNFATRGVAAFTDYRPMLAAINGNADCVVIPTPIALHAEMHAACVQAGLAVYLEKPPTLDPTELERMVRDASGARFETQVGFNFIMQERRRSLKQRLLDGEFGALREVLFDGRWPRPDTYFTRNNWAAGLMTADGRLLLDSCFANAMAHFVHNTLFWAGLEGMDHWAEPREARAVLFRAHSIAGADTFFVEATVDHGVKLRLGLTHACAGAAVNREELRCADAVVRFDVKEGGEIVWNDGRRETWQADAFDQVADNVRAYCAYLKGQALRPVTRLTDSRPFVALNALVYLAAGSIHDFSACGVDVVQVPAGPGVHYYAATGIGEALDSFLGKGQWPRSWVADAGRRAACVVDEPALRALVKELSSRPATMAETG
jgi:predicted dehydrogenase